MIQEKKQKKYTWLLVLLTIIMALRITSYFTLFPSSIGLTRVVKVGMRFFLTGFSIVVLITMIKKIKHFSFAYENHLSGLFYLGYALLGIASIIWSTDVMFTVLQLMMLMESIFFVVAFYHLLVLGEFLTMGRASFARILAVSISIISVCFLVGLYFDPSTFYRDTHGGAVSRLGGFIINPNELGMLAVIGASMTYIRMKEGASLFWNIFFWVICVAVLLLTQSRSSLGAFLLVTGMFILMSKSAWLKIGSVGISVIVLPILVQTIIIKDGNVGEVMSMTGRLPFWSDLITYGFPERPILGYGFMSISDSPFTNKFDSIHAYAASMTHNTFVQVLINLGLVGAFICLIQMLLTFFAIGESKNLNLKLTAIAMLIPLLINSATEFGIFGEANYGIYFYHLVILMFIVQNNCSPFKPVSNE